MTLLTSLFQYKAWANQGLYGGLMAQSKEMPENAIQTATRILSHAVVVDRIFVAHLQRQKHAYADTDTDETPTLKELQNAARETDQWYIDYVADVSASALAEMVDFAFTDGTPGRMSREEMLAHVLAHGGYHRGEVGRIMTQLTGSSPRDTFTGYLRDVRPAAGQPIADQSPSCLC